MAVAMTTVNHIRIGSIVTGPTLPEPVEVLVTMPMGSALKIIGRGRNTGMTYDPVLSPEQIAQLQVSAEREPFDGDARLFRLGIEAQRLGLAYEYDPFFSLSIARVDPLPHQLEAVYGYFLRLPRIRFLLADDPGSGKTIMAGLTHKELKARGLVKRVLIVAPANLTSSANGSRSSAGPRCGPTTARTRGRNTIRSSRRCPGHRSSMTPAKACSGPAGTW
jgi:hypothetical protein